MSAAATDESTPPDIATTAFGRWGSAGQVRLRPQTPGPRPPSASSPSGGQMSYVVTSPPLEQMAYWSCRLAGPLDDLREHLQHRAHVLLCGGAAQRKANACVCEARLKTDGEQHV